MTAFFSRFIKYGPLNSDIDSRFSRSSSYPSVTNYNLEFPLTPPFAGSAEIYIYDTMKYTVIERSLLMHFRLHGMNQNLQSKVILPAALSTGSISKMILAEGTFSSLLWSCTQSTTMHGATLLLTIDRNFFFCRLLIKIVHRWEELLIIRKLPGDTSEASEDIISQSLSDKLGRLVGGKCL